MADPEAVIVAVIARLDADAAFRALITDGAWKDVTPANITAGAVVNLTIHQDDVVMGGKSHEIFTLLIKAVHRHTDDATVKAAAVRIHAMFEDADDNDEFEPLVVTGYDYMKSHRVEHVSFTEIDDDSDERWQHCGGRYEIWMSPQAA